MKFTLKAKAHSGYRKASTVDRDADFFFFFFFSGEGLWDYRRPIFEMWVREAWDKAFCLELTSAQRTANILKTLIALLLHMENISWARWCWARWSRGRREALSGTPQCLERKARQAQQSGIPLI